MPELHFKGKEFVYNHHLTVPYRPLEPQADKSIGEPSLNGNLIIQGDNLHALKALMPLYAGKVDCVFIDPPYNTGNENWSYNDNVNSPMMREWLSSNPINKEDMLRHDKWLAMMYPRIKLLYELLADTGSFWMTLNDNEIHRARAVLDEIFGEECFIASVVWQKRTSPEARLMLGAAHDYVLVYSKRPNGTELKKLGLSQEQIEQFSNPDEDPLGAWVSTDMTAQGFRPNQMYKIKIPSGNTYEPPAGRCWSLVESEFLRLREAGRIWFGVSNDARPRMKTYLSETDGVSAWTWWTNSEAGDNQESKKEVNRILGADAEFDYPKPVRLLSRIMELATGSHSIVLDSFAGSGTTAHAVLAANQKDGGDRKFILVECEDYADKLTAERVRRVINGYEFTGTQKEELLRENLTFTSLKNADKLLHKIDGIENLDKHRFDDIKKTVKDGVLTVVGERKVTERTEGLGGSFTYCTLGEPLDLDKLLTGENLPTYEALGAWAFHTATGEAFNPAAMEQANGFLGESAGYFVWLVYKPDLDFLKSREAALTLNLAETITQLKTGKRHLVFAPAKFVPNKTLLPMGVEFAPLPFALYRVEKA